MLAWLGLLAGVGEREVRGELSSGSVGGPSNFF